MNLAENLAQGIAALGIAVSPEVQEKLLAHIALIQKWNRIHNLTAVREATKMVSHHLLDCLAVVPHLEGRRVVDVGSGAGFPGIPLALVHPQWDVTLLDSNHKKAVFLQQAIIELGIANASVVRERVEEYLPTTPFDLVLSRAYSDLSEFAAAARSLCAPEGTLAAMKGVYPYEELGQLPAGCSLRSVISLKVPGLRAERHLVLLSATG